MKVLIINTYSHIGSTGKITYSLYNYLKDRGHDVLLCTRGYPEDKLNDNKIITLNSKLRYLLANIFVGLFGDESIAYPVETKKLKKVIDSFNPDIVQLYNVHDYYVNHIELFNYLKKKKIPVVYSMLDEYAYMGKCRYSLDCEKFKGKCTNCPTRKRHHVIADYYIDWSTSIQKRKNEVYTGFQKLVFTGPPFVCQRAKESYLLKECDVRELFEPFNFEDYYYPRDTKVLRAKLGIDKDDKVIVCASGTTERKGGKYFLEVAKKLQNEHHIKLIFIGYNRNDWDFPQNIIVKGYITDQNDLAGYMSLADAYVCTSVGDSTPSVCLAALGCGTPLIGFEYGGVMDCAPQEFGTYVPIGDLDSMAKAVLECKKKTPEDVTAIRNFAINRFSPASIFKKQENLYKELLTV